MTFKQFLCGKRKENSPIGDLARDVRDDPNFPKYRKGKDYIAYLESKNASYEAIQAFKEAWLRYHYRELFEANRTTSDYYT
jgi:uncharacterized protein YozE (UPF0346 family)